MSEADDELLARATEGDQEAAATLLERHGPHVRNRLAGKISPQWRNVIDEDDVMQVTYLEAFLTVRRFKPRGTGSFLAWLTRVAENNLRDAVRELERAKRPQPKDRVAPPSNEDSVAALYSLLGATQTTPSRHAARGEAGEAMEHALARLPADYAKVVRLYDLECRPVAEVSAAIGRSEGAVYMLRARAHDRLRELMGSASQFFSHPT